MNLPVVNDARQCQAQGCGCCGAVQVSIGHSIFKFSENAFRDWVSELTQLKEQLESAKDSRVAEVLMRTALADRHFSA